MRSQNRTMEAVNRSMECSITRTHQELKRGLNGIATIGSTAPFVGLFGTVIGIMNSFRGCACEKSAYMGALSGGIAEALVTTSLGLLVAVPAVWAFNYYTTQLETFDLEMNQSLEFISTYLSGFQAMKRDRRTG